ncbi:MAG: maleylacetoacetate isomerase [Polyangiales bacterium]
MTGLPNARLYAYWRSSASWRVRIALHLKQVPFTIVPVHLMRDGGEQKASANVDRNPMAQVPTLEWDSPEGPRRLTQSLAIVQLVDACCPGPALLPTDPFERARAWEIAEVVNAGTQPLQNLSVLHAVRDLGGDPAAWASAAIAKGLAAVERLVADSSSTFCVGETPGVADLCLVPQLYNARRFSVDLSGFPRLLAIESACVSLGAFELAHPDVQPDAEPAK